MPEKRKVGRPRGATGVRMPESHRDKIRNSNVLNALIEHALGKREMSPSQVTAGLGLLKKALPDLSAVTHDGEVSQNVTFTTVYEKK